MFEKYINQLLVNNVFDFEEDKILMMKKVPFVMFPARSMAVFLQKISKDLGINEAKKLGYNAGSISGKNLINAFNWVGTSMPGRISSMQKMLEIMGFGKMDIKIWNTKENKTLINITNHPTIEWANKMYGKDELICGFYASIYSAHANIEFGMKNCKYIETQCICKGAKFCEWSYNVFKDKPEDANKNKPDFNHLPENT
jgi:predicted hydrocarbon binding protein